MSWLETPCRIAIAGDRIREAIYERMAYMGIPGRGDVGEFAGIPNKSWQGAYYIDNIRHNIRLMYVKHFPPVFGEFTPPCPYGRFNEGNIDDYIAAELQKADIDPAGFFWTKPHRWSDGNFARACYHLLNNVLLYRVPSQFYVTGRIKTSGGYVFPETSSAFQTYAGCLVGKIGPGDHYYEELDRHYTSDIASVGLSYSGPQLIGEWKALYTASRVHRYVKDMEGSVDGTVIEQSDTPVSDTCEINFSGENSGNIPPPWSAEIFKDIDRYRDYALNNYYYVVEVEQFGDITDICITPENLPPPNYKYLD